MSLITFDQARNHLRRPDLDDGSPVDGEAADLLIKIETAEGIILDYLKTDGGSPPWDESTVPAVVRAAVLLQLGELYRFRGDDAGGTQTDGDLSPTITNLLRRYRDPALA